MCNEAASEHHEKVSCWQSKFQQTICSTTADAPTFPCRHDPMPSDSPVTILATYKDVIIWILVWFFRLGKYIKISATPVFFPCFFVNEYSLLSQSNFMFKVLWHQLWPVLGWDSLVACYLLLISKGTQPLLFPFSAKEPKNLKMHSVHHWWWS